MDQTLVVIVLIGALALWGAPAAAALGGVGGVWKFLAILFTGLSGLFAAATAMSPLFILLALGPPWLIAGGCWVMAWIFAGVATGAARREDREAARYRAERLDR